MHKNKQFVSMVLSVNIVTKQSNLSQDNIKFANDEFVSLYSIQPKYLCHVDLSDGISASTVHEETVRK